MRRLRVMLCLLALLAAEGQARAEQITTGGQPAELDIRTAGERSLRVTLRPIGFVDDFPATPVLAKRTYPAPALSLREIVTPVRTPEGTTNVAGERVFNVLLLPHGTTTRVAYSRRRVEARVEP